MVPTDLLFRPDTWDRAIFENVAVRNEYGLPDRFEPGDVIVDVGAHVGSFSYAVLRRGAGKVLAYEANRKNYGLAFYNLSDFGDRAQVIRGAVWRSDAPSGDLQWGSSTNPVNTGGGGMLFGPAEESQDLADDLTVEDVPAVALDDVLRLAGTVRLLKLDCEGAEWPILLTSRELGRVQEIVGEYHEIGGQFNSEKAPESAMVQGQDRFTEQDLVHHLQAQGFDVTVERSRDAHGLECSLGHFRAVRAVNETEVPALESAA